MSIFSQKYFFKSQGMFIELSSSLGQKKVAWQDFILLYKTASVYFMQCSCQHCKDSTTCYSFPCTITRCLLSFNSRIFIVGNEVGDKNNCLIFRERTSVYFWQKNLVLVYEQVNLIWKSVMEINTKKNQNRIPFYSSYSSPIPPPYHDWRLAETSLNECQSIFFPHGHLIKWQRAGQKH